MDEAGGGIGGGGFESRMIISAMKSYKAVPAVVEDYKKLLPSCRLKPRDFAKRTGHPLNRFHRVSCDLRPNSKSDLFRDIDGHIFVKPNGSGPGDPTGMNIDGY